MNLYSLSDEADPEIRQQVEKRIMSKIDAAAADALRQMIDRPGTHLGQETSDAWILFLMSMIFRTPPRLRWLHQQIRSNRTSFTAEDRASYDAHRQTDEPATPEAYFSEGNAASLDAVGVTLMVKLIGSKLIGSGLARMSWTVHRLKTPNYGLLTCDDPVMTSNGMNSGDSFVILPVAPDLLFLAANTDRAMWSFTSQTDRAIERAMNDAVVAQADRLVIGKDVTQAEFIRRRLGRSPVGEGVLGRHAWKCP